MASPSRLLAGLAFVLLVPGSIALAYLGFDRGLYGSRAVPIALGLIVVVGFGVLFLVLPRLRALERSRSRER